MKKIISTLGLGLIPLAVVFLFMKFISLNISYVVILGVLSLILVSLRKSKSTVSSILPSILMALPLTLAFYLLVVKQIPGLWPIILLFLLTPFLINLVRNHNYKWAAIVVLISLTGLLSFSHVPRVIADNLTEEVEKPAPDFQLENLLGDVDYSNSTLKESVVILDFFGTWCAPCISEMEELKQLTSSIPGYNSEWKLIIACTDTGGDNPEKAVTFHKDRKLPFQLAYDHDSKAHKSFEFSGVPGLVILDKSGKIRLKHEGFNPAENIKLILAEKIEELINEKHQ